MLGGNPGYYPVPSISDLMLYVQPLPGCYLDSTNLASGQIHTITAEFFDATGTAIESATPLTVYVDNNPCSVSLAQAAIGASSATTDCGYLAYNPLTAATDDVTIAYSAGQPEGFANWSFSLTKAGTSVYSTGGPVTTPPTPFAETVAGLLGTCTVAAFAAYVYVAATANTGWSRCSQYDRSALEAFALAPRGCGDGSSTEVDTSGTSQRHGCGAPGRSLPSLILGPDVKIEMDLTVALVAARDDASARHHVPAKHGETGTGTPRRRSFPEPPSHSWSMQCSQEKVRLPIPNAPG